MKFPIRAGRSSSSRCGAIRTMSQRSADLLLDYRDWIKRHKDGRPIAFLEHLAEQWGYTGINQIAKETCDEATIALVFAEIKLRGCCDDRTRDLAMLAIERQRVQAVSASGWPYQEERLRALATMEAKLRSNEWNS